jgi:hypothetical protein
MRDGGFVLGNDVPERSGVAGNGGNGPLSATERSRRFRARRAAERRQPRGYSWPPAEPGNLLAVRHGAHSPRLVGPEAAELHGEMMTTPGLPPFIRDESYRFALAAWAQAEAMAARGERWLAGMSDEDAFQSRKAGSAAPAEVIRRLQAHAAALRARCGLDPASRVKMLAALKEPERDLAKEIMVLQDEEAEAG